MAKEILKDEILKDEQLDNIAGGNRIETCMNILDPFKRRLLNEEQTLGYIPVHRAPL